MTLAKPIEAFGTTGIEISDDHSALATVLRSECSAAIWQRQTPPHVQSWLDALDPEHLPRGRVILPPGVVTDTVDHLCNLSGLPLGNERSWLHKDIVSLATLFSELVQAKFLRLRLDVVSTNACRKFHVDAITARLVCTYRGTGTQYGFVTGDEDPDRIYTVPTGSPIILRGTLWPADPPSGLLHRSPPIEGTGETRLVLVLDPVFDPEDDA